MPRVIRVVRRLITLWLILKTTATLATKCWSPPCRCYQQSDGIYSIVCVGAGLRGIPQSSLDFYAQILNFSGNRLAEVADDAFRNAHLQRLEIVDLSDNGIERVARDAFAQLTNLLEVDLSGNRIDAIRDKMFAHNRFLNTIRLSGNPIRVLGERAFPLSVYLRTLHFQGCQLKRIHRYAFFSTPLLEHLNLKDNALKSPPMTVLRLTRLRTLQLDGNPWKCDDRLRRVLRWLRSKSGGGGGGGDGNDDCDRNRTQSLLCVFGETQNAVFWDTMEVGAGVDDFGKIQKLANHHHHPRRSRRRRSRRERRAINTSRKTHIARHQKISGNGGGSGGGGGGGGSGGGHGVISDENAEPEWMVAAANSYVPTTWNYTIAIPVNCTQQYEYSPTRFLKNYYSYHRPNAIPTAAVATAAGASLAATNATIVSAPMTAAIPPHPVYSNAKVARNYVERPRQSRNTDIGSVSGSGSGSEIETNMVAAAAAAAEQRLLPQANGHDRRLNNEYDEAGDGGNLHDGDTFIEKNHAIILGAEVVLIVILLMVLYQLWKENRRRVRLVDDAAIMAAATAESGVNIPLNNGGARVKNYDTQTEGYKRYSLSDEEYTNIRNGTTTTAAAVDEGKYDAESGYLSYHRYNSIEGDNPIPNSNNNDYGGDTQIQTQSINRCSNGGGGGGGGDAAPGEIGSDSDSDNDDDTPPRIIAINGSLRRGNSMSSRRSRTRQLQHSKLINNDRKAAAAAAAAAGAGAGAGTGIGGTGTRRSIDRVHARRHSNLSGSGTDNDDDFQRD